MANRRCLLAVAAVVAGLIAPGASASQLVDRDATGVTLEVSKSGMALLNYHARGKDWHVLAWGAVNALTPTADRPQIAFRLDYSGGWGTYRRDVWKTFSDACAPYAGPPLAWAVIACTAPDGSHWALQAWQRMLPDYGLAPSPAESAWELRLSHWSGDLPALTVRFGWSYRRFQQIYGVFDYLGQPVYGFHSTSGGSPLDSYGRNLYVDTLDSAYGLGWHRENSFLVHKGTGAFCYGFYPHAAHPSGKGTRYRGTIIGPGVAPDVMWESDAPATYDPSADLAANTDMVSLLRGDSLCRPN